MAKEMVWIVECKRDIVVQGVRDIEAVEGEEREGHLKIIKNRKEDV